MTTRTFTASDWLAAIDIALQAPPSAPPSAPTIDAEQIAADWPTDEAETATQPAASTQRRIRNLPAAVLAWLAANALVIVGLHRILLAEIARGADMTTDNLILPALLVLALTTTMLLAWLILAWRYERL